MQHTMKINNGAKEEIYTEIIPQFRSLLNEENDEVVILGILSSLLKTNFNSFSWVGFYLLKNSELVLGPFQGKPACMRISLGKGVCGTSAQKRQTIIVPDVDAFPGHIRCDADARSEIVIPLFKNSTLYGVLDVDSFQLNNFDETDKKFLEELCREVSSML